MKPGSGVDATTGAPRQRLSVRTCITVVGCLAAVAVIGTGLWVWQTVQAITGTTSDPMSASDAIVVFAGEDARFRLAKELAENGVTPTLVLSMPSTTNLDWLDEWCDHPPEGIEVMCVTPEVANTQGEARMFAELARSKGWRELRVVTGNYHANRVSGWMNRCWDGDIAVSVVDWPTIPGRVVRKELAGAAQVALWWPRC